MWQICTDFEFENESKTSLKTPKRDKRENESHSVESRWKEKAVAVTQANGLLTHFLH